MRDNYRLAEKEVGNVGGDEDGALFNVEETFYSALKLIDSVLLNIERGVGESRETSEC